jgi:AcrR family transcriptional regulator
MKAKTNSTSARTRLQIILAAERLFGEQGIDAVSLRQINIAANQKNSSATHYHFGDKITLVAAIYNYRMASVNSRREEILKKIPNAISVRQLVEAMVYPIVDEIEDTDGGKNYIAFLSQMIGNPSVNLGDLWSSKHGSGLNQIFNRLTKILNTLPAEILSQRFGLTVAQIFHSLADRERLRNNPAINFSRYGALFVSNLIDCQTGSFSAPISAVTQKEIDNAQSNVSQKN